jgi:MYXO-CTERM domain-containing protein
MGGGRACPDIGVVCPDGDSNCEMDYYTSYGDCSSSTFYSTYTYSECAPQEIACEGDEQCPSDWSCTELSYGGCAGGGYMDDPVYSGLIYSGGVPYYTGGSSYSTSYTEGSSGSGEPTSGSDSDPATGDGTSSYGSSSSCTFYTRALCIPNNLYDFAYRGGYDYTLAVGEDGGSSENGEDRPNQGDPTGGGGNDDQQAGDNSGNNGVIQPGSGGNDGSANTGVDGEGGNNGDEAVGGADGSEEDVFNNGSGGGDWNVPDEEGDGGDEGGNGGGGNSCSTTGAVGNKTTHTGLAILLVGLLLAVRRRLS